MQLSHKQTILLDYWEDNETSEIVFGGAAGGGKSMGGGYCLLKSAVKYPGTRWLMGRTSLKTLKETTLNSFYNVCAEQGMKNGTHYKFNPQSSILTINNGSEILCKDIGFYPSDPNFDELGSLEITGAFIDECNQAAQKAWAVIKSRIRYKLDDFCNICADKRIVQILKVDDKGKRLEWICGKGHVTQGLYPKILGSCNPAKNWVYNDFYSPHRRGELKKGKIFIPSLITDNPYISKHYYNNLLSLDNASKERLLYGNWDYDEDPSALCEFDAICDAFTCEKETKDGKKYISADLAMQGRDRFVAGSWNGLECAVAIDKEKAGGKEIETDLKQLMAKDGVGHSQTVADTDGLGAYLESYLNGIKEFHGGARAINSTEYGNLKSECAFKLAEVINKREIKIICSPEQRQRIIEELGVLKRDDVDADDKRKKIIRKDKMKELLNRSPDYLDMLLMRMLFKIKREEYRIYTS